VRKKSINFLSITKRSDVIFFHDLLDWWIKTQQVSLSKIKYLYFIN